MNDDLASQLLHITLICRGLQEVLQTVSMYMMALTLEGIQASDQP